MRARIMAIVLQDANDAAAATRSRILSTRRAAGMDDIVDYQEYGEGVEGCSGPGHVKSAADDGWFMQELISDNDSIHLPKQGTGLFQGILDQTLLSQHEVIGKEYLI